VLFVELDGRVHGPGWVEAPDAVLRVRVSSGPAGDGWVIDGQYRRKRGDMVVRPVRLDPFPTLPRVRRTVLRVRASVVALPAATAVAVVLAVAACGGGEARRPTQADTVRAAVRGYLGALAAHDWKRACRSMTPDARRRLVDEAAAGCADALAAGAAPAEELESAQREVAGADVRVRGAVASLGPIGAAQQSMRLRRVAGRWLIAG
jgi:hypothetical protein